MNDSSQQEKTSQRHKSPWRRMVVSNQIRRERFERRHPQENLRWDVEDDHESVDGHSASFRRIPRRYE